MATRKPIGLALVVSVAAMAMMAVGVASASAAPPEYVPKAGGFPIGFTSTSGAGTLQTKGGTKVSCKSDTNTGKIINAEEDEVIVTFEGCSTLGGFATCTSAGATSGHITTEPLKSLLVYEPGKAHILDLLSPKSGTKDAEFVCAGVTTVVQGSVLGTWETTNKQSHTNSLLLAQSGGVQQHTKYLNRSTGAEETATLESKTGSGSFEQAGEETTDSVTLEGTREVEIKG